MNVKHSKLLFTAAMSTFVAVALLPEEIDASKNKQLFPDVKPSHYFYDSVISMHNRQILSGFPDGTFKPNSPVSRGQAAKIIANTIGSTSLKAKNPNFKDIFSKNSYYPYIASLYDQGVISNNPNYFRPNDPITRYELAEMLAAAFNLQTDSHKNKTPFKDVDKQYAEVVSALYQNGITTGKTATNFGGEGIVTRGQIATFVTRAEAKNVPLLINYKKGDVSFASLKTTGEISIGYEQNLNVKFGLDEKNSVLKIYIPQSEEIHIFKIHIDKKHYYALKNEKDNTYNLVNQSDYNALGYTLSTDNTVTHLPKDMFYFNGSIFIPKTSTIKEFEFVHDGINIRTKISGYDLISETISIEVENEQNLPLSLQQVEIQKYYNSSFKGHFSEQKNGKLTLYFNIRAGLEFTADNLYIAHENKKYLIDFKRDHSGTTWSLSEVLPNDPVTIAAQKVNEDIKKLIESDSLTLNDLDKLKQIEVDYQRLSDRAKKLVKNYDSLHYSIKSKLRSIAELMYLKNVSFSVKNNKIQAKINPLPESAVELLENYRIDFIFDFYEQNAKFYFPIVEKDLSASIPLNGRNKVLEKTFNSFVTYSSIYKLSTTYVEPPLHKVGEVYELELFDFSPFLENDIEIYIQPGLNYNGGVSGGPKTGRYKILGNYK